MDTKTHKCLTCDTDLVGSVYGDMIKICNNFNCDKFKSLYIVGDSKLEEVKKVFIGDYGEQYDKQNI